MRQAIDGAGDYLEGIIKPKAIYQKKFELDGGSIEDQEENEFVETLEEE